MAEIDSNVKLLCHFNGIDNSKRLFDNYAGNNLTSVNNARLKTSLDGFAKVGTGVGKFDGTGDFLSVPDSDDWAFGSSNFTLEGYFYITDLTNTNQLFSQSADVNNRWSLVVTSTGVIQFFEYKTGSLNFYYFSKNSIIYERTWYHIEAVRNGTNVYIFLNGIPQLLTTSVAISTKSMANLSAPLYIGVKKYTGVEEQYLNGYIDEIRISKGTARHTDSFTPPTTPHTSDANTQLLLHCEGSDTSTTFTDDGNTGHTVTANGDAQIYVGSPDVKFGSASLKIEPYISEVDSNTQLLLTCEGHNDSSYFKDNSQNNLYIKPLSFVNNSQDQFKFGRSSASFDGIDDGLIVDNSGGEIDFGTGDFTIEYWVKGLSQLASSGYVRQFDFRQASASETQIGLMINHSTKTNGHLELYVTGTLRITGTSNVLDGNWHHVALVRNSGSTKLYVNGTQEGSSYSDSNNYTGATNVYVATRWDSSGDFRGYFDDIRMSDIARYTSNFTAPTESFLGNGAVTIPYNSEFEFGTNDYTIDFWFCPNQLFSSSNKGQNIIGMISTSTKNLYISYNSDNTGKIYVFIGDTTGEELISLTRLLDNVWYHIALVRNGTTVTLYIDGTSEDTYISSIDHAFESGIIIASEDAQCSFYLDEVRISNGVARWTSNFTPPTEEYSYIPEFLDFQIEINETDYTDKADMQTIKWTNYENFSNTADAFFIDDTNFIKMGMELIIRRKSDSKIVFGGLIQEPKKVLLSPNFMGVKVHAESYKQILGRRTFELDVQNQLAGTTVQGIFDDYLKAGGTFTDEELTLGNIDNGITIENYVKRAQSGLKLFNDLADASDYKWWITNEKAFYFQSNPTYTDNTLTKKLTPNKSDPAYINCIDLPDYNEDSSNFRTRQNVIGKKINGAFVFGSYTDSTAETEMATRYGSGVFGATIVNDNISTTAEADALAQSEVETYVNPAKIRFKTTDFIEPLELIKVDISILGISDETYKVTSVSYAFDNDVRIVCDVTCEKYTTTNKPKRTWTDEFNEMVKENTQQSDENDFSYNDNAGVVNLVPAVPYLNTITHILDKDKALHCHYSIVGVASGAGTVTVTFDINTVVQKTFTFDVVAGNFAKTFSYPIRGIATSGSATVDASTTSTVAIAIAINDLNFWVKLN